MIEEKLREEFRKKFGQFYVSIHKDGTPRLVDTEGGEKVNATDDGQELRVFASTTQENWWLSKFREYHKQLLEEDIKTIEGMKKKDIYGYIGNDADKVYNVGLKEGFNSALSHLIDSKKEALNKLKD